MIYLNKDDLITVIQERLLDESDTITSALTTGNSILDSIEQTAIDLAIAYLAGEYDYTQIFAVTPIRNGVLVQLLSSIVVYRAVRRNAARKVPEDLIDLYKEAIKTLEKIQSGAISLVNCPLLTNADGTTASPIYGNNTNTDYFI